MMSSDDLQEDVEISLSSMGFADRLSQLSHTQEVALVFLPIIPALLSMIGSTNIMYMVVKEKKRDSYKRLLFALSLTDFFCSVTFATQAFLLPKSNSHKPFALGNATTCTLSGALFQFGTSQIIYYGMLNYYYLFTVRLRWKRQDFAKWIEPVMHLLAIGWPLCTSVAGVVIGLYDELDLDNGCWVDNYPKGCYADCTGPNEPKGCYDDCTSSTYGWIFMGSWFCWTLLSVTVINIVLYLYVRKAILLNKRHSFANLSTSGAAKVRNMAIQALLFVGAFLLTYIWTLILQILESLWYSRQRDGKNLYALLVLQATFRPMAGFFNLIIYIRPRYNYCRQRFPNKSKYWCVYRALHGCASVIRAMEGRVQNENERGHNGVDDSRSLSRRFSIRNLGISNRNLSIINRNSMWNRGIVFNIRNLNNSSSNEESSRSFSNTFSSFFLRPGGIRARDNEMPAPPAHHRRRQRHQLEPPLHERDYGTSVQSSGIIDLSEDETLNGNNSRTAAQSSTGIVDLNESETIIFASETEEKKGNALFLSLTELILGPSDTVNHINDNAVDEDEDDNLENLDVVFAELENLDDVNSASFDRE